MRLSRIRLPPRVFDGEAVLTVVYFPTRLSRFRLCARRIFAGAFPSAPPLAPPTPRRTLRLVRPLHGYLAGSDFSCPCIIGFGSSPSDGTSRPHGPRSGGRPPRFRRVPFVRDGVFDRGRASAPRIAAPHMLPSACQRPRPLRLCLSRLNRPPHAIAVYASRPLSPVATQHSLPGGRYPLPGPVFHRLDRASFAWRTGTTLRVRDVDQAVAIWRRVGGRATPRARTRGWRRGVGRSAGGSACRPARSLSGGQVQVGDDGGP